MYDYRPYLTTALTVYLIEDGKPPVLLNNTEFIAESRISIYLKLKAGKYMIIPITTCPQLHGSLEARDDDDPQIIENEIHFSSKVLDCLEEMFNRY